MSLMLMLTGKSNVLAITHFPARDLSDDDYELGLMNFETYNIISNVNVSNNKFYFTFTKFYFTFTKTMWK